MIDHLHVLNSNEAVRSFVSIRLFANKHVHSVEGVKIEADALSRKTLLHFFFYALTELFQSPSRIDFHFDFKQLSALVFKRPHVLIWLVKFVNLHADEELQAPVLFVVAHRRVLLTRFANVLECLILVLVGVEIFLFMAPCG